MELSLVLGLVVFGVYYTTLYPSLPGGDSGELITAAHELGVAHPPGYPLFTLLAWAAIRLVPCGSVAWRVSLQTAMFGGVATVFLSLTVLRLTRSPAAAVLAVGLWGWSKLTWAWSITAEVFALNNLFVALLMFLALKFEDSKGKDKTKMALVGSLVCGLSLCNQHTMVVYVFCFAVWVLYTLSTTQVLTLSLLVKIGLSFVAGLLPYLYLPVSSWFVRSRWTWGDQRSVAGFLTHLLRMEYGTFDLGKGESGQGLMFGLRSYFEHVLDDLTPAVVILSVLGVVCAIHRHVKRGERSLTVFITMTTAYLVLFSWRANLDLGNPLYLGVVERFWMQSDLVVITIAAVAFSDVTSYLLHVSKLKMDYFNYTRPDLCVAMLLTIFQLQRHYRVSDNSNNWVIHQFGEDILRTMPLNSIVLTKGDLPSNTFRYFHLCENIRPDIQVFDQEILTYEWSLPKLGWTMPHITFPGDTFYLHNGRREDGRMAFTFRRLLDVNYHRGPILGCIGVQDHEPSWQAGYTLVPYGVCSQFVKHGANLDIVAHIQSTQKIAQNWTYPYHGYAETSWEFVTTSEMWNAKISTAYFLYDRSQNTDDTNEKRETLIASYQIYTKALEDNPRFPPYWHKNYALACERMLYVTHSYNKHHLIRQSIHHFEMYLTREPSDSDRQHIQDAIKMLQQRLASR